MLIESFAKFMVKLKRIENLAITAEAMDGKEAYVQEEGAKDSLYKPYSFSELN